MHRDGLGVAVVWWALLGLAWTAEQRPPAGAGAALREATQASAGDTDSTRFGMDFAYII